MAGIDLMLRYSSKKKSQKRSCYWEMNYRSLLLFYFLFLFEFLASLFSPTPSWFFGFLSSTTTKHQFHAWNQIVVVSYSWRWPTQSTGFYPFRHQMSRMASDDGSELSFKFQHLNKQEETTHPKDLTLKRTKQQARGRKKYTYCTSCRVVVVQPHQPRPKVQQPPEKSPKKVSTWFDIQKSFHQLIEVEDEQLAKNNNNNNILVSELPGQNSRRRRMMDESFGPAKKCVSL